MSKTIPPLGLFIIINEGLLCKFKNISSICTFKKQKNLDVSIQRYKDANS